MSEQDQSESTIDARESLGAILKAAREQKKLTVKDIASRLMLDQRVITSLECGDYSQLPELTFVRGYLIAYLRLLEKPESLLEQFDEQNRSQYPLKLSMSVVRPSCSDDGWVKCISLGLVALLLLAIGLWLVEQQFHVFLRGADILSVGPASKEDRSQVTVEADSVLLNTVSDELPAMVEDVVEEADDQGVSVDSSSEPGPGVGELATELNTNRDEIKPPADIVLRFIGESWVRVEDAKGERLAMGVYQQGEEVKLYSDNAPFSLIVGSAGHVEVEYKGRAVDLSRKVGKVARLSLGNDNQ